MNRGFFTIILAATLAALFVTGCAEVKLRTGEYRVNQSDRDDFAAVYGDLIFVHVKSPENVPGRLAYWEWAGKYRVRDDGEIEFDMDHETARRWHFSFQFVRKRDGILINEWEKQNGLMLRYRTPKLKKGVPTPRPTGSTGVDPVYQDMSSAGN